MANRTLNEVKSLLQKLQRFSPRNCTQQEFETASLKARRLLEEYQLSMADIAAHKSGEELEEQSVDLQRKRVPCWQNQLAVNIAYGFQCTVIESKAAGTTYLKFLGHVSDVEVAKYFYTMLARLLPGMAKKAGRLEGRTGTPLRRYVNTFIVHAGREINRRLAEDRTVATRANSVEKALVVVKGHELDSFVRKLYPSLRNKRNTVYKIDSAANAGREAGSNIPLNRGVASGNGNSSTPLLA
jgi:hypothetical protein